MLLVCFPGKGLIRTYPLLCLRLIRDNPHKIIKLILACRRPVVAVFQLVWLPLPLTLTLVGSCVTWLSNVELSRGLIPCLQLWLSSVC